jgi:tetratricopeptide (TPR) repeat protein
MAQPKADLSTIAKKILGGEELSSVFGVTDKQIQAQAALGYNLYQQGKLKEAEVIFRSLTAVNTKSPYGYAGLGAIALAKRPKDLNAAYENISKAASLAPRDATIQSNLGEVLLRQGKFDEAGQQFKKALELDPDGRDPGANRARALLSGLNAVASEVQRLSNQAAAA